MKFGCLRMGRNICEKGRDGRGGVFAAKELGSESGVCPRTIIFDGDLIAFRCFEAACVPTLSK